MRGMFHRLLALRPSIDLYFEKNRAHIKRCLTEAEWVALRQLASLLEPASEVTARIQGNADGFLSRVVYLMKEVLDIYKDSEQDVMPDSMATDAAPESISVVRLMDAAQQFLKVMAKDMEERGLGQSNTTIESVALYLDPRTKSCGPRVCFNGGTAIKAEAIAVLHFHAENLKNDMGEARSPENYARSNSSSETPPTKRRRSRLERQELSRAAEGRAAVEVGGHAKRSSPRDRLRQELDEYEVCREVFAGSGFDLLQFWQDNSMPTIDEDGNTVQAARWPILAMFARLYHGNDGTSCEVERNLSNLSLTAGDVRGGLTPRKVEQFLFLRLNASLIREVKAFEPEPAATEPKTSRATTSTTEMAATQPKHGRAGRSKSDTAAMDQKYNRSRTKASAHQAQVAGEVLDV